MSSVGNVTNQLNNIGGCNSDNCCDQISALTARISSLESKVSQAQSTASKADGTANEALTKILGGLAVLGLVQTKVSGLVGEVGSAASAAAAARSAAAAAAAEAAAATGQAATVASGLAGALARIGTLAIGVAGMAVIAAIATKALSTAEEAVRTAISALDIASGASRTADSAYSTASSAIGLAQAAGTRASSADEKADNANRTAGKALQQSESATQSATEINSKVDRVIGTVQAIPGQIAETKSLAGDAKTAAERAEKLASSGTRGLDGTPGKDGERGRDGTPGIAGPRGLIGTPGTPGTPGKDGKDGKDAKPATTTPSTTNPVTPSKEEEILALLRTTKADVIAIPAVLVASQMFQQAAENAAAAGSCKSSKPGGCAGGNADRFDKLDGQMGKVTAALSGAELAALKTMEVTLNTVNSKLGNQITGGLSKWTMNLAEIANRSQILNILTWVGTLHNAYFASNALTQTLFSAVSNSLAALGIKDTSTDPAGTPFNISQILGSWTETYFKSIFGVATVEGIKSDWKKYSRIYQAAAQVMYSVQSIGQSVLGALEVVGSHVAKIGNGLKKFRIVGEKAFSWMNPQPGFQNRFFTVLQGTQEMFSQVDQVSSTVLSTQESITQMQKNKDDLYNSMSQNSAGKDGQAVPIASKVLGESIKETLDSNTPINKDSILTKP